MIDLLGVLSFDVNQSIPNPVLSINKPGRYFARTLILHALIGGLFRVILFTIIPTTILE